MSTKISIEIGAGNTSNGNVVKGHWVLTADTHKWDDTGKWIDSRKWVEGEPEPLAANLPYNL